MFPGARGSSIPKKDILVNFLPGFPGVPFENEGTGFPKWPQPYGVFTPPARDTGVYTNLDYSPQSFAGDFRGTKYWIEESRIRGGYNNASTNLGIKAHLYDEESSYNRRDNALIYSGVYNKRTEFNRTNVFNGADNITRALDPTHGSVQYLHAMDNDLTILQEAKVNKALIDKDAIYSAEGLPLTTQSNVVIGQVTPYVGDFGIAAIVLYWLDMFAFSKVLVQDEFPTKAVAPGISMGAELYARIALFPQSEVPSKSP